MDDCMFQEMKRSMEEALAFAKGEDTGVKVVHYPKEEKNNERET